MFYEQLKKACLLKNLSVSKALESIKTSKSTATSWKNGGCPNSEIIVQLSELLEVTTDFLLKGKENELTENSKEMLILFNKLSERDQLKEIGRLETLTEIENLAKSKEVKSLDVKNA